MLEMMLKDITVERFSKWLEYLTTPGFNKDFKTFHSSLGVILLWPVRKVEDRGNVSLTMGGYFKKGSSYDYYEKYSFNEALKAEIELQTTQRISKSRRDYLLAESKKQTLLYEYLPDLIKFDLTQLTNRQLEIKADCQEVVTNYFEKLLLEIALRWPEVKDLVENYNFARMLKRSGIMDVNYLDLTTPEEDDGEKLDEWAVENRPAPAPQQTTRSRKHIPRLQTQEGLKQLREIRNKAFREGRDVTLETALSLAGIVENTARTYDPELVKRWSDKSYRPDVFEDTSNSATSAISSI